MNVPSRFVRQLHAHAAIAAVSVNFGLPRTVAGVGNSVTVDASSSSLKETLRHSSALMLRRRYASSASLFESTSDACSMNDAELSLDCDSI